MSTKHHPTVNTTLLIAWSMAALFYAYDFLLRASTNVLSHNLITQLHLSATEISVIGSMFYWFYVLVQIPAGICTDRFGVKRVMIVTTLMVSVGTLIFSAGHNTWTLSIARALMGAGAGSAFICVLKLAGYYFPRRLFPLFASFAQLFGYMGAALSGMPLALVIAHFPWRMVFIVFSIFGAIICVCSFLFVKPIKTPGHRQAGSYKQTFSELGSLSKNPQIMLNGLYCTFMMGTTAIFSALWGINYLTTVKHISTDNAATASSLVFIGVAITSPLWGIIASWFNNSIKPLIIVAFLAIFNAIVLLYIPTTLSVIFITSFLLGAFQSVHVLNFTIIHDLVSKRYLGTAIAYLNMFTAAGGALLQPVAGFLIQHHTHQTTQGYTASDYKFGLMVIPIILIASFIISLFFKASAHGFRKNQTM